MTVTDQELTEEMIAVAMAKAEARVCVGPDRCFTLPSDLDTARARCTPKGRCRVGLIVGGGGRESFDHPCRVSVPSMAGRLSVGRSSGCAANKPL